MSEGRAEVFTPKSDETIIREAELLALRAISDNVANLATEMAANREAMATMREDMAVIKERQQQHSEFRDSLRDLTMEFRESMKELTKQFTRGLESLEKRIDEIETRNAKQDGAYSFATAVKDFGPWLLAILAGTWAVIRSR